jgi:hypothetical protein
MRNPPVLPPMVLDARALYIKVKREHGICIRLTCSRPCARPSPFCEQCGDVNKRRSREFGKRLRGDD